jgi:hypothetical protein
MDASARIPLQGSEIRFDPEGSLVAVDPVRGLILYNDHYTASICGALGTLDSPPAIAFPIPFSRFAFHCEPSAPIMVAGLADADGSVPRAAELRLRYENGKAFSLDGAAE